MKERHTLNYMLWSHCSQAAATVTNVTCLVFKMVVTIKSANGSAHHLPLIIQEPVLGSGKKYKGKKKIESVIPLQKSLWSHETDGKSGFSKPKAWTKEHWASWRKRMPSVGLPRMSRSWPGGDRGKAFQAEGTVHVEV